MSLNRVYLIALFELQRLVATGRGLLLLAVIGFVWSWIQLKVISQASGMTDISFSSFLSSLGMTDIAAWPIPELAVYWDIGIYLLPLMALLFSVDVFATDREKGTLKFWRLRATVEELVVGRYLGKLCSMLLIILASALLLSIDLLSDSLSNVYALMHKLPMILALFTLVCMPYIAVMTLFSILSQSPRKALLLYIVFYFLVVVLVAIGNNITPMADLLSYLLPGHGLTDFARLHDWPKWMLIITPCLQSLFYIAVSIVVARRVSL